MNKLKKGIKYLLVYCTVFYIAGITALYFYQEEIIFHPNKLGRKHVFRFEADFEELFLRTKDNKRINAVYFKAKNPKGVMLLFHGNTGDLAICGNEALEYLKLGYDVLIPDYRSYGKSDSDISEENLFSDAIICYEFLIKKGWNSRQVTLYGRSLGTGIASYLASERKHKKLILHTPYFSMKRLALEKYPFIPAMVLKYPLETNTYLKNVHTPVYIFHGTKDKTIPCSHAKDLHRLIGKNSKLILIKNGGHDNLGDFKKYKRSMKKILTDSHTI